MKKIIVYTAAFILGAFGLLTLFLSTSVILDLFDIRAKEGNYVLFIVWANFISSLLYLMASYGFAAAKKWTFKLLGTAALILIAAFIGLLFYVNLGGIHETKTIYAMVFRISLTLVFAGIAYYTIPKATQYSKPVS